MNAFVTVLVLFFSVSEISSSTSFGGKVEERSAADVFVGLSANLFETFLVSNARRSVLTVT